MFAIMCLVRHLHIIVIIDYQEQANLVLQLVSAYYLIPYVVMSISQVTYSLFSLAASPNSHSHAATQVIVLHLEGMHVVGSLQLAHNAVHTGLLLTIQSLCPKDIQFTFRILLELRDLGNIIHIPLSVVLQNQKIKNLEISKDVTYPVAMYVFTTGSLK